MGKPKGREIVFQSSFEFPISVVDSKVGTKAEVPIVRGIEAEEAAKKIKQATIAYENRFPDPKVCYWDN